MSHKKTTLLDFDQWVAIVPEYKAAIDSLIAGDPLNAPLRMKPRLKVIEGGKQ